jgi:hypothetical protein
MYLQNAQYNLTNAFIEGGQVYIGLPGYGRFNQYGGSVVINSLGFGGCQGVVDSTPCMAGCQLSQWTFPIRRRQWRRPHISRQRNESNAHSYS